MTSQGLQKVDGRGQTAETIFAERSPKEPEKADRLIPFGRRLCDSLRNCLEDPLEPFRLNASKNAPPKEEISDGANRLGRPGIVHYFLQNFVARCQPAAQDLQHAAIVQLLEHLVGGQDRFCVLFGCLIQAGA